MLFDKTLIDKNIVVLYVEDEIGIVEEFVDILNFFVDSVITARNGEEGYAKFLEFSPDIVITDIQMPILNGLEMIQKIRKTDKEIPIIVTSAFNDNDYLLQAINLGVEYYLIKPVVLEKLETKLKKIIKYILQEREILAYKKHLEKKIAAEISLRETKESLLIEQNKAAEIGIMVHIIAHQWRQPLHYLSLLIEDLAMEFDYQALSKEYIKDFTKKGINKVQFLSETMDNFLNFYKSNTNKNRFNVDKVIKEIVAVLSMPFKSLGIDIEINIKNNFSVYGIENEFQQIIFNIINNAKEAFSGKSIDNAKIYLELDTNENEGIIKIIDNAGGIDADKIETIFDIDYTTKIAGNGIGLYLVKKIITERFHSNIVVNNIDDKACFTLLFDNKKEGSNNEYTNSR
ncbi:response regulator [Sulfurimonas sp. SAG-AH-194-C21]|nr:response regulator [Sulfurimonas sp. SAG-AH-194-C21]MDF1883272.1 response regulator [Sulfurimonas sp. SAG-AH-194-C21]